MGNSSLCGPFGHTHRHSISGDFQYNLVQTGTCEDLQQEYTVMKDNRLGEGITGSVCEVISNITKEHYAMKSINLGKYDKAQLRELENEIDIIRSLDHPNIIKIFKVFKSKKNIYIIMELLEGGELSSRFPTRESQVIKITTELLSACKYWHSRNVVHRDLKLENIMFTTKSPDASIKVIDFGLGTWFAANTPNINGIGGDPSRNPAQFNDMWSSESYNTSAPKGGSEIEGSNLSKNTLSREKNLKRGPSPQASFDKSHSSNSLMGIGSSTLDPHAIPTAILNKTRADTEHPHVNNGVFPNLGIIKRPKNDSGTNVGSHHDKLNNDGPNSHHAPFNFHRRNTSTNTRLKRILMSQVGTAYFMAPEVTRTEGYDQSCDLWAIGVIVYMMITRKEPFGGDSEQEIYKNAARGKPSYDSPNWNQLPLAAKELVQGLLDVEPSTRLTADQALKSTWLNKPKRKKAKPTSSIANPSAAAAASMDEPVIEDDDTLLLEKEVISSFKRFVNYTKLKRAALMVIAHNTNSEKLHKLRNLFMEIDYEKTGTITIDEFRKVLEKHGVIGDDCIRLFRDLDQDRSGVIRYMEFLAATIETQKMISAAELAEAFDHLDLDHSGYITTEDLRRLLGQSYTEDEVEDMIKESDLTGDNKVSRDEFMQVMTLPQNKLLQQTMAVAQRQAEREKMSRASSIIRAFSRHGSRASTASNGSHDGSEHSKHRFFPLLLSGKRSPLANSLGSMPDLTAHTNEFHGYHDSHEPAEHSPLCRTSGITRTPYSHEEKLYDITGANGLPMTKDYSQFADIDHTSVVTDLDHDTEHENEDKDVEGNHGNTFVKAADVPVAPIADHELSSSNGSRNGVNKVLPENLSSQPQKQQEIVIR